MIELAREEEPRHKKYMDVKELLGMGKNIIVSVTDEEDVGVLSAEKVEFWKKCACCEKDYLYFDTHLEMLTANEFKNHYNYRFWNTQQKQQIEKEDESRLLG